MLFSWQRWIFRFLVARSLCSVAGLRRAVSYQKLSPHNAGIVLFICKFMTCRLSQKMATIFVYATTFSHISINTTNQYIRQ
uniref:YcgB protein n=1 Tax=Escherichia coli TaxID=562 RepID=A0A0C5AXF9_ECOLX|nr:YcgB protein [Escherichia coli]